MEAVGEGTVEVLQPPHWLAEVLAVMARLSPATLESDLADLYALQFDVAESLPIYERAGQLSVQLQQHVFDTLYHAVALETEGCALVTADARYLRQAAATGRIVELARWRGAL
jgi:predicted nucleic acid-binding protein